MIVDAQVHIWGILIDIRSGDWVDCGNAHFRLCGCEGLVEDDVDVIKPSELGDLHEISGA